MSRRCIETGRRAGFCPSDATALHAEGGSQSEADKRLECLMVGSRVRNSLDSINNHLYELRDSPGPTPREREDHLRIIDGQIPKLDEAVRAARKSCGWYDDSAIGHAVDVISHLRGAEESEVVDSWPTVSGLMNEMEETESKAIAADPPLFRNLRRVVQSRPAQERR